jgi:hypothetical protein
VVAAIGVASTFLVIGLAYVAVTLYGFFNPAFREMDALQPSGETS